ncbi:GNAT family N-acetyltransferase [Janibacter sp. CX7]|uniref:GNAT family N-acetyltransferase n=1 Tax=Janibacter sp. CX7 TaxID=2963431 RepID=UPI0020CF19B7|nr:GNAT family N-acetyltransferase [Janibacter sp. CX7]UTT66767.1 GNAT family N-acetyltransferase [Janibacter sp. CX7]
MSDLPAGLTTGQRVAVRSRIDPPPTAGPTLTDTVGELVDIDATHLCIATRTGDVTVARDRVVAARVIPPKPTRRGAPHRAITLEDLHLVMTRGQPGVEEAWLGAPGSGWLLRAGLGWTGRSNSALPVGDPGLPLPEAVDAVEAWYAERDLPPLVMLPRPAGAGTADDALGRLLLDRGYRERTVAEVLTGWTDTLLDAPVPAPAGITAECRDHVDEAWLAGSSPRVLEHRDAAREILALPRHQVFLTAHDDEGSTAGVVRVALSDGWAGVFGLHVAPEHRGRGVGRWLTVESLRAAAADGASLTYLQVEPGNAPAQHLYRDMGLTTHHDYVYLALR